MSNQEPNSHSDVPVEFTANSEQQPQEETSLFPERQVAVLELEALINSNNYVQNIVDIKGADLRKEIEKLEKTSLGKARGALARLQQEAAYQQNKQEGEDIDAVKVRLGKQGWKQAVNSIEKVEVEMQGQRLPVSTEAALQVLATNLQDDKTKEQLHEIQNRLTLQEQNIKSAVSRLKKELQDKQNDPGFIQALEVWGKSPNLQQGLGKNGKGFNAGITHYFEYRADKQKAGKFKNEPESAFSIQGFVDYSSKLNKYIMAGDNELSQMHDVRHYARFKDEKGQERLYLDTDKGHVIAFKGAGDNLKIITVITTGNPNQAWEKFQKSLSRVGSQDESGRLNQLGDNIELIGSDEETQSLKIV